MKTMYRTTLPTHGGLVYNYYTAKAALVDLVNWLLAERADAMIKQGQLNAQQKDFVIYIKNLKNVEWSTPSGKPPTDVCEIIYAAKSIFSDYFKEEV